MNNKNITVNYQNQKVKISLGIDIINNDWEILDNEKHYFVITDQNIDKFYHEKINNIPNLLGLFIITPGENSKSLFTYEQIIQNLQEIDFTRNDVLLAIGGGVVTDLVGMVAGTYKRGVEFINIPTSLIGMVDASIGGKCGINFHDFKNQIGLFNHPTSIIIDYRWLDTLSNFELINGLVEMLKIATTSDVNFFNEIINYNHNLTYLYPLIEKAIKLKTDITICDEKDNDIRQILNYGHTIGHIIEKITNFTLSHGQAVAIGMLSETQNPQVKTQLIKALNQIGLMDLDIPKFDYLSLLKSDKKFKKNQITLVEVNTIGKATLKSYYLEELTNEQFW